MCAAEKVKDTVPGADKYETAHSKIHQLSTIFQELSLPLSHIILLGQTGSQEFLLNNKSFHSFCVLPDVLASLKLSLKHKSHKIRDSVWTHFNTCTNPWNNAKQQKQTHQQTTHIPPSSLLIQWLQNTDLLILNTWSQDLQWVKLSTVLNSISMFYLPNEKYLNLMILTQCWNACIIS